MKKKLVLVALLLSFSILFSVSASNVNAAAPAYYTCNLKQIGSGYNSWLIFLLTDAGGAFTNKWFYVPGNTDVGKEMLATALTAASLEKQLKVYTDYTTTPAGYPGPTIIAFLLIM